MSKALFISPRNSKEGQLNLFEQTNCHIIAYAEPYKEAVHSWIQERRMKTIEISPFDEWFPEIEVPYFPYNKTFEEGEWEPFAVFHTSGSTGLPKPIVVRQGMVAIGDALKTFPMWNGGRIATHALARDSKRMLLPAPLFHFGGVIGVVTASFYEGCPVVLTAPDRPITSGLIIECLESADVDSISLPPGLIEELSQSKEGIQALTKMRCVSFTGSNLARECGNRLVEHGVRLLSVMGSTEWAPFPLYENPDPALWQYFRFHTEAMGCEFRKWDSEEGVYEMIIVRKKENQKHPGYQGVFYTFPNLNEWSTKDLYRPHSTLPDYWIYHGRADNIIVFSNAEKLNPITIEETICGHPELKAALVVGSQRFQAGLILEPCVYPDTKAGERALLDRVWPWVEKANLDTVQHGRISRDMVALSSLEKPFLRASQGYVQRALTIRLYEEEIHKMYETSSANSDKAPKIDVETQEDLIQSIVETLRKHLAADKLEVDVDFFAAGIDSLGFINAAKIIRAGLMKIGYDVDAEVISPKVIYTNSTPRRLATYIFNTVVKGESGIQHSDEQQQDIMHTLYYKYTQNLLKATPNRSDPRNENQVIVLTGSTGSLGSYLLDLLGRNPRIAKVICLNRAADGGRAQQVKALIDRGLDIGILDTKAEFFHADLSKPDLGLGPDEYVRLQAEADRVICNAWPVNFNLPIESFEPFINGVRHVCNLAATTARRVGVTFISSIATAPSWHAKERGSEKVPETRLEDMSLPLGGYGCSKMVGSLIIEDAAAQDAGNFPYAIIRIGQIAGPLAEHGMWNRQEWLPSMIASSLYLGALPSNLGAMDRIDWTPVEAIAKLVLEAAGISRVVEIADEVNGYYHGVNPHESQWQTLAVAVQEFYGDRIKELVPFSEWCDRLERSQTDGEASVARNPGVKLIDSYRNLAAGTGSKPVVYDMVKTMERCPVVRETAAINADMMKHWCNQWGF